MKIKLIELNNYLPKRDYMNNIVDIKYRLDEIEELLGKYEVLDQEIITSLMEEIKSLKEDTQHLTEG
jgi:hypothetical protein